MKPMTWKFNIAKHFRKHNLDRNAVVSVS